MNKQLIFNNTHRSTKNNINTWEINTDTIKQKLSKDYYSIDDKGHEKDVYDILPANHR